MNQSWLLSIWQYFFSSLYFVVPIAGVALNCYVLRKLRKIAKYNAFRFESSSALPLCAMSISDSICLISLFSQAGFHVMFRILDFHRESNAASFFCKIDLYLIHTASAFSVWCWLILSVLRYTAVFYPFRYRTIWRQPRDALMFVAIICSISEFWIPYVVAYDAKHQSCNEVGGNLHTTPFTASLSHIFDIFLSYVIPAFIRIILDGIVLFHCYKPNVIEVPVCQRRFGISAPCGLPGKFEDPSQTISLILSLSKQTGCSTRAQPAQKKTSMIKRSLIISVINLCCNLPSHALRGILTLEAGQKLMPEKWESTIEAVSQLLYFGQFTCNCLYLSTTIYETTVPTRTLALLTTQQSNNSTVTTPAPQHKNTFYGDFVEKQAMAEFSDLSVHCSLESCRRLDFLPFLCKVCRSFYCGEHRFDHGCKPTESQVLTVTKSDDGKFKQFLCSLNGCFEMEWIKMTCSYCDSHFCLKHKNCEDHECVGLIKPTKETARHGSSYHQFRNSPKKNVDPTQQARSDKIAAMRLKAKNSFKIPLEDALIVFVNNGDDRIPVMISKDWSINRCKTICLEQCGFKSDDSHKFALYSEKENEEAMQKLELDHKVEYCLQSMQDPDFKMRYYLIAILLYLFALPSQSIEFKRKFGFRTEDTAKNRLAKIGAIPKIPPPANDSSNRIVPQKSSDKFDICKTQEPCSNEGLCVAEGNSFYCECPNSFYGKFCEFVADDRECINNMCQNNSTCYSVNEERTAFSNSSLTLKYKCWCKKGTTGDFCEYTEEMRQYAEDHCNHHGIVDIKNFTNDALCKCEENYFGPNCENVSPCRDFECINLGVCKLNATNQSYCECPKSLEFSPNAKVSGDHCENIWLPDSVEDKECRPCSSNYTDFITCLESRGISKDSVSYWWKSCDESITNCFDEHLSRSNCFNGGKCVVAAENVTSGESNLTIAIPRCECQTGYEGLFCERRIPNLCESLSEADKCINGKCAFNSRSFTAYCICNKGYYGRKCEFEKPCTSHECGDALCIELPVNGEDSEEKFPVCVCNSNQVVDNKTLKCTNPYFKSCTDANGVPKCKNNAYCYPCLQDNAKNSLMNACDDTEWNRGFRCICPPGFAPPFCDRKMGPCDSNRCMNNAKCHPVANETLEYKCICPRGYSGTFCEQSEGMCSRFGDLCVNGVCVNDVHYKRGFQCQCDDYFEGINCEQKKSVTVFYKFNKHYEWTYPSTLLAFLTLVLGISMALKEYSKRLKNSQNSSQESENT
ncbi:hypothetical protein M3Y97_00230700 [Aphelenchoides bicaudatus]|nr:hypothetical protein M3Y97_00230700 [Aphelenchoides bicaudatus]